MSGISCHAYRFPQYLHVLFLTSVGLVSSLFIPSIVLMDMGRGIKSAVWTRCSVDPPERAWEIWKVSYFLAHAYTHIPCQSVPYKGFY
jgi:hypothetical protein